MIGAPYTAAEDWLLWISIWLACWWGRRSRLEVRDKTDNIPITGSCHSLQQTEFSFPAEGLLACISVRQAHMVQLYFLIQSQVPSSSLMEGCGRKWADASNIARRTMTVESANEIARNKALWNSGPTIPSWIPLDLNNFQSNSLNYSSLSVWVWVLP